MALAAPPARVTHRRKHNNTTTPRAALKQGRSIRYVGPGGPTSFDSFHDSTGIFQVDNYSPAGQVTVIGNLTTAQLRALQ